MQRATAKIYMHPSATEDVIRDREREQERSRAAVQDCIDDIASISQLMGLVAEGEYYTCAREYLVRQLEQAHIALDGLMAGRGIG